MNNYFSKFQAKDLQTFLTISTAYFMSGNDQCIKINTSGDFEIETPSHIGTTHAISKPEQKF